MMAKQATELRYAVRPRVLCRYFGQLCLVVAALSLVPLAGSLIFDDASSSLRYTIVIGGLAAFGIYMARLPDPSRVQANQGMVLVALMFLFTPLVMSYPMMGSGLAFMDAFFEAVSGVTTTGLSTMETLADIPPTFLFARAWMQWYGGLGIVVLSLSLIIQPGLAAKGLGILGALALGMVFFDALLYTFSAISTGGFAPHDSSLATFDWPVQLWITLFCLAGAIPLAFYHRMVVEKRCAAVDFLQIKALFTASLVVSLAMAATLHLNGGMAWPQAFHHAPLLAFSAQTTAGFSSMPSVEINAG